MNELKPIKTKKQIAKINHTGYIATERHISQNYIKLEKGYYSLKELFLYTLQRLFGDRVSEIFK